MFCPECRCEFRSGFTRCESCDTDLVASLDALPPAPLPRQIVTIRMADYCGFLSLEEARESRDLLRDAGVRSEIVIRESPESDLGRDVREEYWLRVDVNAFDRAEKLIGMHEVAVESNTFSCSECGATVADEATACPKCGARFDDE